MNIEATLEKPQADIEKKNQIFHPNIEWDKVNKANAIDLTLKYADKIRLIDDTNNEKEQKRLRNEILEEIKKNYIKKNRLVSFLIPKKECMSSMSRKLFSIYLNNDMLAEVAVGEVMDNFIEHSKNDIILFSLYIDDNQIEILVGDPEKTHDHLPESEKEMPDYMSDRSRGIPMIYDKEMIDYANVMVDNASLNPKQRKYYTVHIGKSMPK